ncbi:glycoside hydrolase family 43 protein [Sodiomyces alkalinus F11]|uniref:Arabinan endo-1,5-alpha-L-arabinosidase n=1 Tax=Sodiomyces alkalinus (strain CBS 110278 / VKM F-3762 / F11) TaxID=1314773 RepID=A0A3N2PQF9_SODAK|nr:glycoside hydrolase family 43 protein [Sodiomyces alkalinus F11]ROT36749.1 glycoside hydrolase family 43 protein [Sodiomyces alkalinus F11]
MKLITVISTLLAIAIPSIGVAGQPGLALGSTTYPNPGICTGTCVNTHDPFIVRRSDGVYFRFSTSGRVTIHTASAITGPWTYQGAALPGGSTIDLEGNQDLWAPDVIQVDNTYYLYYSVSTFGSQTSAIGVAQSSTLDAGSWTDLGSTGIDSDPASEPYNAIDANLIRAAGGQYYMTFGSYWAGIHQVAMRNPPTQTAPGSVPYQIVSDPVSRNVEGATLFPRNGFYYLFYSKGFCCRYDQERPPPGGEYRVLVCRSESPAGNFVDRNGTSCTQGGGTVVLESHGFVYGPGGQGVYLDPQLGPVLYYHYLDTRIGYADRQKQFGWNRIDFSSGWPVLY